MSGNHLNLSQIIVSDNDAINCFVGGYFMMVVKAVAFCGSNGLKAQYFIPFSLAL